MEIVHYAPTIELSDGKVLQHGQTYTVRAIRFSQHTGVLLELVGFEVGRSRIFHSFMANHFRTRNGKQVAIVKALPNTRAHATYGDRLLNLVDLKVKGGVELVMLYEKVNGISNSTFPYSEFTHV